MRKVEADYAHRQHVGDRRILGRTGRYLLRRGTICGSYTHGCGGRHGGVAIAEVTAWCRRLFVARNVGPRDRDHVGAIILSRRGWCSSVVAHKGRQRRWMEQRKGRLDS
eukprot:scaffold216901_cov28-Tisochrysis_lutea.AAC.4